MTYAIDQYKTIHETPAGRLVRITRIKIAEGGEE